MLEGKRTPNFGQYISKNHGVNGRMHEKIQALVLLILLLPLQMVSEDVGGTSHVQETRSTQDAVK